LLSNTKSFQFTTDKRLKYVYQNSATIPEMMIRCVLRNKQESVSLFKALNEYGIFACSHVGI